MRIEQYLRIGLSCSLKAFPEAAYREIIASLG